MQQTQEVFVGCKQAKKTLEKGDYLQGNNA